MNAQDKQKARLARKSRVRAKISGTATTPRASVFKSNTALYLQFIDDEAGKTLFSATTLAMKGVKPNKEGAVRLAEEAAKLAQGKGITSLVFDRNGYRYHGNVKHIAETLREKGLKF